MIATQEQREVWEYFRPVSEAAQVFVQHDWDVFELEQLEDKWNNVTLPHLQAMHIEGKIHAELERVIKFCQDRIKKATEEYERGDKLFAQRKELMEGRIPTAEKFLKLYQSWRGKEPSIKWEPMDVVDIKRRGMEAFIRSNLERFFNH